MVGREPGGTVHSRQHDQGWETAGPSWLTGHQGAGVSSQGRGARPYGEAELVGQAQGAEVTSASPGQ